MARSMCRSFGASGSQTVVCWHELAGLGWHELAGFEARASAKRAGHEPSVVNSLGGPWRGLCVGPPLGHEPLKSETGTRLECEIVWGDHGAVYASVPPEARASEK